MTACIKGCPAEKHSLMAAQIFPAAQIFLELQFILGIQDELQERPELTHSSVTIVFVLRSVFTNGHERELPDYL